MKFPQKQNCVLVEVIPVQKDGKKPIKLVKVADRSTFENETFFLNEQESDDNLGQGELVGIELDIKGKFTTATLKRVSK